MMMIIKLQWYIVNKNHCIIAKKKNIWQWRKISRWTISSGNGKIELPK